MKIKLPFGSLINATYSIIGKKENEHYVAFIFPEINIEGPIINFIIKYALQQQLGEKAGDYSKEILELYNSALKYFYGGFPVSGKMTITEERITFSPLGIYKIMPLKGYKQIIIPLGDIISVTKQAKYFNTQEYIVVKTILGEFKCMVFTPSYLGSTMGDDICNQIQKSISI